MGIGLGCLWALPAQLDFPPNMMGCYTEGAFFPLKGNEGGNSVVQWWSTLTLLKALGSIPTVCASCKQELGLWNGKERKVWIEGWACWHTRSAGTDLSEVEIYSIQGQSVLHGEIFSQETKRNRIHTAV